MHPPVWDLIVEGLGKLEAPCFDLEGRLCMTDRAGSGRILRLEPDGSLITLAERAHVGGLAAHASGGLVASGHQVSHLQEDGSERLLLDAGDGWGFNDLTTDAEGRVFVGRFDVDPLPPHMGQGGSMWRIDGPGVTAKCYGDVALTNGVGLSPDGSTLYHNDTAPRTVWVTEIGSDGMPQNRRSLCQVDGSPDGMAVDEAGCLWIALMGSGRIVRVTPEGQPDMIVDAPRPYTSSVCFDGYDLYAVTFGGPPYDEQHSGAVFRAHVGVAGAPVHPATV